MKSEHQKRVERFLAGAKHTIPDKPTIPPEDKRLLQARLLVEEVAEAVEALGFNAPDMLEQVAAEINHAKRKGVWPVQELSLEQIAKELCDVRVVATGTMSLAGMHDEPIQTEVDGNNIMKLASGTFREDGKFMKAPWHPKPAMGRVLACQELDQRDLFMQMVKAELLVMLGFDRYSQLSADDLWKESIWLFKMGLTAQEAALSYFKAVLESDLRLQQ